MEEGWVLDGTIAQDTTQVAGIWALREGISVALKHAGAAPAAEPIHWGHAHGLAAPFRRAGGICQVRRRVKAP